MIIRNQPVWIAAVAVLAVAVTCTFAFGQDARQLVEGAKVSPAETAKLVAVLESNAPLYEKTIACKQLAVIGTPDAVPVLVSLLSDEKLAHYARFALEPMPDVAVDKALRDAVGTLEGKFLVGAVNSIGTRKDAGAVDVLVGLVKDSDPKVTLAAAAALGRIATPEAAETLKNTLTDAPADAKAAVADSCLACAEGLLDQDDRDRAVAMYQSVRAADVPKHLRVAATYGEILARGAEGIPLMVEQLRADDDAFFAVGLQTARLIPGDQVTKVLMAELEGVAPERRTTLLLALADRGDIKAFPAMFEAVQTDDPALRLAAVRGMGSLGEAIALPALFGLANDDDPQVAEAAVAALKTFPGDLLDTAVLDLLEKKQAEVRELGIILAGSRRIESALPAIVQATNDSDSVIRLAALKALEDLAGLDELPNLLDRAIKADSPEDVDAAKRALQATCDRLPKEAASRKLIGSLDGASLETKTLLFELLGGLGGDSALEVVSAAAKGSDEAMQDLATRILGEWMDADAGPILLDLAKTSGHAFQVRALRGYIRIPRQLEVTAEQRLAMCREALAAAERLDEKKLVLDVLARNASPESLAMALEYLDAPGLKANAAAASVKIGGRLAASHRREVVDAMRKVIASGVGGGQLERAKMLLGQVEK